LTLIPFAALIKPQMASRNAPSISLPKPARFRAALQPYRSDDRARVGDDDTSSALSARFRFRAASCPSTVWRAAPRSGHIVRVSVARLLCPHSCPCVAFPRRELLCEAEILPLFVDIFGCLAPVVLTCSLESSISIDNRTESSEKWGIPSGGFMSAAGTPENTRCMVFECADPSLVRRFRLMRAMPSSSSGPGTHDDCRSNCSQA
jgi:hypothetical protein